MNDESGYTKAFCNYLRKGMDAGLEGLASGSDPDGGYLVTPTMSSRIVKSVHEASTMRQICSVETISTDALELIDDHNKVAAGWSSETATTEDSAPIIAKRSIPTHELYAQPKATQKLVDDSAIDVENWLSDKISDIFSRKENTAFIQGTGVGMPRGILTFASGTNWGQIQQIKSGNQREITADALVVLFYGLKDCYAKRASFIMNRTTAQTVRLLKLAATNQFLWQPGLSAGAPDTLLGCPVYLVEDMPSVSSNSLPIAVGDFQAAYQIVDKRGVRILRDPFTEKPFVKFYTTKRVGGDVVDFDAVKILKMAD